MVIEMKYHTFANRVAVSHILAGKMQDVICNQVTKREGNDVSLSVFGHKVNCTFVGDAFIELILETVVAIEEELIFILVYAFEMWVIINLP